MNHESPSTTLDKVLYYLKNVFPNYPYNDLKDALFFEMLIDEFPRVNIGEELKDFCAWTLDQPDDSFQAIRSLFRKWVKMADYVRK